MIQIAFVVGLNTIGLALAAWGVTMLLGTHHPFVPVAEVVITSTGLGMIATGTFWIAILLLIGSSNRVQRAPAPEAAPVRSATPTTPVPQRDQLVTAMEDLMQSALSLIERRRELHHLNMRQWHHAHTEETDREIEAAKRYRQAKSSLELYRLSLPTQFWTPVDGFADAVEESINKEAYSAPKDKGVHEDFNRYWHAAMREINDITFSLPPSQSVGVTAVN